jgi:uncharacterized protein
VSRRVAQLVLSCVVLGVGVALLLRAALGSDGYSSLINGLSLSLDVPFVVVNAVVGLVLVALAWSRHVIPGLGTIVQPVVVGFTVSGVMSLVAEPDGLLARGLMLAVAFPVLAIGVAGYLGAEPVRARQRRRRSRSTVRCRFAGATASCRAAGPSPVGCSARRSAWERSS